jgi:putative spermidine/putrescine transport system ATP-binding protein
VVKTFDEVVAMDQINLTILKDSSLSFSGPSGCDKTPPLQRMGHVQQPDQADIVSGEPVAEMPSHRRHTHMIFQHDAFNQGVSRSAH